MNINFNNKFVPLNKNDWERERELKLSDQKALYKNDKGTYVLAQESPNPGFRKVKLHHVLSTVENQEYRITEKVAVKKLLDFLIQKETATYKGVKGKWKQFKSSLSNLFRGKGLHSSLTRMTRCAKQLNERVEAYHRAEGKLGASRKLRANGMLQEFKRKRKQKAEVIQKKSLVHAQLKEVVEKKTILKEVLNDINEVKKSIDSKQNKIDDLAKKSRELKELNDLLNLRGRDKEKRLAFLNGQLKHLNDPKKIELKTSDQLEKRKKLKHEKSLLSLEWEKGTNNRVKHIKENNLLTSQHQREIDALKVINNKLRKFLSELEQKQEQIQNELKSLTSKPKDEQVPLQPKEKGDNTDKRKIEERYKTEVRLGSKIEKADKEIEKVEVLGNNTTEKINPAESEPQNIQQDILRTIKSKCPENAQNAITSLFFLILAKLPAVSFSENGDKVSIAFKEKKVGTLQGQKFEIPKEITIQFNHVPKKNELELKFIGDALKVREYKLVKFRFNLENNKISFDTNSRIANGLLSMARMRTQEYESFLKLFEDTLNSLE